MNVGKRSFGALNPMIEDMGGGNMNQRILQGICKYEQGRDNVVGRHNNVQAHLSRVRRVVPEIDL